MAKEIEMQRMQRELIESAGKETTILQVEITNLKKVLEEKLKIIEELKTRVPADWGQDQDSDNELTLKGRVFKKVEQMNEFIRNEITPEIHERYAKEIEQLIKSHAVKIEMMQKEHKAEIKRIAQTYELKLSEMSLKVQKFQELNKNQEETIRRMKGQLSEEKRLTMEQARRIDDLLSTIKKNEQMHQAHMQRLQGQFK